jgi:hypothetical protein
MPKGIPKNGVNKGRFTENQISYWSGKSRPRELIEKLRKVNLGSKHTEEHKRKISIALFGKKKSLEMRKRLSQSKKGIQPKGLPQLIAYNRLRKGTKLPLWLRLKFSEGRKGEKGSNWKGGITPVNRLIRVSLKYQLWRKAVFERDNYTCLFCNKRGGNLEADHIKQFAYFPELRLVLSNGRTLCKSCHRKTETWGSKKIKK